MPKMIKSGLSSFSFRQLSVIHDLTLEIHRHKFNSESISLDWGNVKLTVVSIEVRAYIKRANKISKRRLIQSKTFWTQQRALALGVHYNLQNEAMTVCHYVELIDRGL